MATSTCSCSGLLMRRRFRSGHWKSLRVIERPSRRRRSPPGREILKPSCRRRRAGPWGSHEAQPGAVRQHRRGGGLDAARAAAPHRARSADARLRQGREPQPRRLGQGPDRPRDHRGRREARRAEAGRRSGRGDERQHRHRPRDRGGDQGLPLHLHHPGQDVEREDPPAARVRRGGDRGADRGAARPPRVLHPEGEDDRGADAGRDLREPALQRRQPARALPRATGPELWEQTEGEDHALRVLAGHRRHRHRCGALPEGEEPEGARRRPATRSARSTSEYARNPREGAGPAVQGRGHRRRQDPDLARLLRRRRVDHGLGRRGFPRRAAPHPGRGDLRRRIGRASTWWRRSRWRAASTTPTPAW